MRYIRKIDGAMKEAPASPYWGAGYYLANDYLAYAGTVPLSRLDIVDGAIVELPALEATEEWVEKRPFVSAITALLTDEVKAALAESWQTQAWIAKLPGDAVNLLDAEVSAFLTAAGLTLEQIRAEMEV